MPHLSDLQMENAIKAAIVEIERQNPGWLDTGNIDEVAKTIGIDGFIDLPELIKAIAGAVITDTSREKCGRHWELVDMINDECQHEGWCLIVCGDGMVIIQTNEDTEDPKEDAYSYVKSRADAGSIYHQVALGMHGMIMTEDGE